MKSFDMKKDFREAFSRYNALLFTRRCSCKVGVTSFSQLDEHAKEFIIKTNRVKNVAELERALMSLSIDCD
jgi:hypothetical protein